MWAPKVMLLFVAPCTSVCVSVGYTMDTMYFGQLDNAVDVDPDVQMPQFKLIQEFVEDCSQNYTTGT